VTDKKTALSIHDTSPTGDELSVLLELEGLSADERSDSQSLVVCGGITENITPTPWKFSRCGHFL
jgi:hypothetical protein